MAEIHETTILQEGHVKITDARAIIGTLSYPMSQIRSINLTRRGRNLKPLLLTIPGIVLIAWSFLDQTAQFMEFLNIGLALIVVSVVGVLIAKPTYAVQIRSQTGRNSILRSNDQSFIQRIVDAMNVAIVHDR